MSERDVTPVDQGAESPSRVVGWGDSRDATDLIAAQAAMLKLLPLEELETFLRQADELGPFLDPTGWMKHGGSARAARRIVSATRRWIREVQEAIAEGAASR